MLGTSLDSCASAMNKSEEIGSIGPSAYCIVIGITICRHSRHLEEQTLEGTVVDCICRMHAHL